MSDAAAFKLSSQYALAAERMLVEGARRTVDSHLIRELVDKHHRFIWRLLGRLGVPEPDLDDATQQVFIVLTRAQLEIIVGSERAFLFGIALKVARTHRRTLARRRESSGPVPEPADSGCSPELLSEQHQARRLLDQILDSMPMGLRVPFVLFEIDDISTGEIAVLLDLPAGTVASRLRRARAWFDRRVRQLQARQEYFRGAP